MQNGKPQRLVLVLVTAAFLTACSGFGLLYRFADTYITSEIEEYLEPNDAEAAFIALKTEEFVDWHSQEMLPLYADLLNEYADIIVSQSLNRPAATRGAETARDLLGKIFRGAAPYAAAVLARHTAKDKVDALEKRLAERLAKRREGLERPLEDRLADRLEGIIDNFERFTGPLKDDQIAIIERYVEASGGDYARWLDNREHRQKAFIDFLRTAPDEAQLAEFIPRILLRADEIVDPDYRAVTERRWAAIEALLFDVLTSLDAKQRNYFAGTLRGYAQDMRDISS